MFVCVKSKIDFFVKTSTLVCGVHSLPGASLWSRHLGRWQQQPSNVKFCDHQLFCNLLWSKKSREAIKPAGEIRNITFHSFLVGWTTDNYICLGISPREIQLRFVYHSIVRIRPIKVVKIAWNSIPKTFFRGLWVFPIYLQKKGKLIHPLNYYKTIPEIFGIALTGTLRQLTL